MIDHEQVAPSQFSQPESGNVQAISWLLELAGSQAGNFESDRACTRIINTIPFTAAFKLSIRAGSSVLYTV